MEQSFVNLGSFLDATIPYQERQLPVSLSRMLFRRVVIQFYPGTQLARSGRLDPKSSLQLHNVADILRHLILADLWVKPFINLQ